jgi:nitrogen fixation NifU-like protein
MYPPRLLEHFRNPRHVGELGPPAVAVQVSNPACGDLLRLSALLEDGVLRQVRYQVRGCTASIAAGSALAEWLTGRPLTEAAALEASTIDAALGGLPPASRHAAALCVEAVRALAACF